eukprot:g1941.t1 g1941   contig11:398941-400188(+)
MTTGKRKSLLSNTTTTDADDAVVAPPPSKKRNEPGWDLRSGVTPYGQIRHCMCLQPRACRAIMQRWCRIKEGEGRVGYVNVPEAAKKAKHTANARHAGAFRRGVFRYMYGEDYVVDEETGDDNNNNNNLNEKPETATETDAAATDATTPSKRVRSKDYRISYAHFHPDIVKLLVQEKDENKQRIYKWRVPIEVGNRIGFTSLDLCPDPDQNKQPSYFAMPNYSIENAEADIARAEEQFNSRLDTFKKEHVETTISIASNPSMSAMEMQYLREKNKALTEELQQTKSNYKSEHAARVKAEEKNIRLEQQIEKMKRRLDQKKQEDTKPKAKRGRPKKSGDCLSPDEKWIMRYHELVQYRNTIGDCRVPKRYPANAPLGKWVDNQRYTHSQGRLSDERFEMLNEIGFFDGGDLLQPFD